MEERLHLFYFQKQRKKKKERRKERLIKMAAEQYNSNVTFTTSVLSAINQQLFQSTSLNLLMTYCRLHSFTVLFSAKYMFLLSIELWKREWMWAEEKGRVSLINLQCRNHFYSISPQHSMSMPATVLQKKIMLGNKRGRQERKKI